MKERLTGKELEEQVEDKLAGQELATDAAMRGDPICGATEAFINEVNRKVPGGDFLTGTAWLWDDEEDDIRPY